MGQNKRYCRRKTVDEVRELSRFYVGVGLIFVLLGCTAFFIPVREQSPAVGRLPFTKTTLETGRQKDWRFFFPQWKENQLVGLQKSLRPLKSILQDPDHRLGKNFRVEPEIEGRVQFWVNVYARFDSRMKIVHDRHNPEITYGYLDFRPLYRSIKNPVRREIRMRRIEEHVLKRLKKTLLMAVSKRKKHDLPAIEVAQITRFLKSHGITRRAHVVRKNISMRTQTGQRDHFLQALHRAQDILPHIEAIFKKKKLPLVLARIPFVESSFNPKAWSKANAMGMWQFTRPTAKEMIPDRSLWMDPIAQTKAAAQLLRNYRRALPDWSTTITSYNSGIGTVRKLVRKHKIQSMGPLLKNPLGNGLGFAGENFYAEVVAAALVESYKDILFQMRVVRRWESNSIRF